MLLDNLDGNFSVLTSSGIICRPEGGSLFDWIPAFAGMTEGGAGMTVRGCGNNEGGIQSDSGLICNRESAGQSLP